MTPRDLVKCIAPSLSLWSAKNDAPVARSIDLSLMEAIKAYKKAIMLSGRLGFINDQALANERLGAYYWSLDLQEEAVFHIQNASRLYQEWGNRPKYQQMQELYLNKISPPETIRFIGDSSLGMEAQV